MKSYLSLEKKVFFLVVCVLTSGVTCADTCYDPDNNSDYTCQVVVEYGGAPVENEVVYGYGDPVDDDVYTTRNYNDYNHGNYNGAYRGSAGGWHR